MKHVSIVFSLLIVGFFQLNAQNDPPTVTICGDQYICTDDNSYNLCVYITVDAGFMGGIDNFVIDWNDGSPNQSIPGSLNPDTIFHTYDLTQFQGQTCNFETDYGFELFTYETGSTTPLYNASAVWFRKSPTASFSVAPKVCVGDEITFNNTSCPTDFLTSLWEFEGGGTSTSEDATHEFLSTGMYDVTLTVTNPCGSDQIIQTIEVISPAEAIALPISGVIDTSSDTLIICMDTYPSSVTVELDGDSLSLNENYYEWQSLSGVNATYITDPPSNDPTPNISDLNVVFSDTGMFQIVLEVNNECNQPDFDTLIFHVLTGESLSEPNQPDACLELIYTPENFNPNATYTINGMIQSTFPDTLPVGNYEVICNLTNECGSQTTVDNFVVFPQEEVNIFSPSDTTLCVGSDSIMIIYGPFGGTWTGDHIETQGDTIIFYPDEVGVFELIYSKGVGDCEDQESITITVIGIEIIASDYEVCSTSNSFLLEADPPGGTWSSTDCPSCINGDTFLITTLVQNMLSSANVTYNYLDTLSGCEGTQTILVGIDDPVAEFEVDSIFCLGDIVDVQFPNANGTLCWLVDGQIVSAPPFSNLSGGFHEIQLIAKAGNCQDSMSQTIFVTTPPSTVSFTAQPTNGCANLEVTLNNTTAFFDNESYEWYLNDSLFSTDKQPGIITLGPGLSDTIYTITLIAGNSCNGSESSQNITVFPLPVPQFGPLQNYYCSGDTVQFSNISFGGPMTSWFWDYGNGLTSTDSIPLEVVYFTDTIPTTYTITLTATNNCGTETFSYDIVINPTDVTAFLNIDPIGGCVGEEICVTNLSTLGANILWDFGDGNTSTLNEVCHIYSVPGTYTIILKAFGCGYDSITYQVTIDPLPEPMFSANTIVCPGEPVNFINTSNNAVSYFWDFGDGNSSTINNPSNIYNTPGNYLVKLFATSIDGCVDSTFSTISILTPPQSEFTVSTDSVCVGDVIQFNSISSPNPLTCFWDFGDSITSNLCNPIHSYAIDGDYIVTLIVTDGNGCKDTSQQLVNVAIVPDAGFTFSQNGNCTPVEITFQSTSVNGESYVWDFGDGMTSTEENPSYTYISGGNYFVQLTVINGVCSDTYSQNIQVAQTPDAEIINPLNQSGCAPFVVNFSSTPIGSNYEYKWDFDDGTFSFENSPTHNFTNPGIYQVMLNVEAGLCADTAFTEIIVFEPVEANATTVDNLCFGDAMGSIELNILSGTPEYQFQWSNGGIDSINTNLSAGVYQVTITDENACTWSNAIEIFQPNAPISFEIIDEKIVTCYGGSDGAITIAANGGTPSYQYQWATGNNSPNLEGVPAGMYPVTITDDNGCMLDTEVTVQQNDSIAYEVMVQNISCFGYGDGQISFENIVGGTPAYEIILPQLDSAQGTAYTGLLEGEYSILLSDAAGCVQTFSTFISEPPEVWIELNSDSVDMLLGEQFQIISTYNVVNPIFSWSPSKGLDCNDCEDPLAQPFNDVTYQVAMMDENGCSAADTIFFAVEIIRGIAIPNIFTPNNDGQNDIFNLLGNNPGVTQVLEFKIFDRYGGMMFEAQNFQLNDSSFGWDGKYKEKDAQTGHYVYQVIIEYIDGKTEPFKGSIMLSR